MNLRNWLFPAALLGLSGLGLLCATERGREQMRGFFERMVEHGDPLSEFSKFVDEQLHVIQRTLDSLAEALEEPQA
jgi:hypothetical protein